MKRRQGICLCFLFLLSLASVSTSVMGIDVSNTRLLSQPAISQDHIAFIYANDLWVAELDGTGRPPPDFR